MTACAALKVHLQLHCSPFAIFPHGNSIKYTRSRGSLVYFCIRNCVFLSVVKTETNVRVMHTLLYETDLALKRGDHSTHLGSSVLWTHHRDCLCRMQNTLHCFKYKGVCYDCTSNTQLCSSPKCTHQTTDEINWTLNSEKMCSKSIVTSSKIRWRHMKYCNVR